MFVQLTKFTKNQSKIPSKKLKITLIEIGLEELKSDMKNMSENEIKNKGLDILAQFIEEVLNSDKMNDMPPLQTEEESEKRQKKTKI